MKVISKIINFNEPDMGGDIFTKDTKFHFPEYMKIIIEEDGIYLETEIDDKLIKYYEKS